jgi:hypothetical protein
MTKDLDMEDRNAGRYNIALFIFFIPYILFEVPSNLVLKKIAPSTWLSLIMVLWGKLEISFCMRILTTSRYLNHRNGSSEYVWRSCCYACSIRLVRSRAFSRYVVCQNEMFHPTKCLGCVYLISMYYKRYELQWRLTLFFTASIIAGAFGGVSTYTSLCIIVINSL